jgi:hypothetical protein
VRDAAAVALGITKSLARAADSDGDAKMPERPVWKSALPDAEFKLSQTELARLRPEVDADAVQRFLASVVPEYRSYFLERVTLPGDLPPKHHVYAVIIPDREMDLLYDAIWAPVWKHRSREELLEVYARSDTPPLGLRTALAGSE